MFPQIRWVPTIFSSGKTWPLSGGLWAWNSRASCRCHHLFPLKHTEKQRLSLDLVVRSLVPDGENLSADFSSCFARLENSEISSTCGKNAPLLASLCFLFHAWVFSCLWFCILSGLCRVVNAAGVCAKGECPLEGCGGQVSKSWCESHAPMI